MSSRGIVKIGHRGAAGHEPENTLAAVEKGMALGCDFIEVDIQRTSDGCLVLMHDKFIDRTTNGDGRVIDMSFHDLRKLDAGRGQKIPLLRELLELANHRVGLILENITPGITQDIFECVLSFGFVGPVILASFHHLDLARLRESHPQAKTMALIEAVPVKGAEFAIDAKATHVGASLDSMTEEFGEVLHQAGLQVFLYTADTPEQIKLARMMKADGIISNFPERI